METITIRLTEKEYELLLDVLSQVRENSRESKRIELNDLEKELKWQRKVAGTILERETR